MMLPLADQSRFATPRYFEKYALVCQPNYMVGAPCICMAEPEAFQDELSSGNTYPIRNTCGPPHGRGWLGSGSSRPTACTPGLHTQHAAPGTSRGGLCRRGCPTKPYFSRRPRGGPHIFYMGVQTSDRFLDPPQSPKSDRICMRPRMYRLGKERRVSREWAPDSRHARFLSRCALLFRWCCFVRHNLASEK